MNGITRFKALKLILSLALLLGLLVPVTTQAQSRVKFDYNRYETEDLDRYRNVVEFVYPALDNFGLPTVEDTLLPGVALIDVSPYFDDTTRIYVDAAENISSLVARHQYLNSQIRSTNGYRIQIVSSSARKTATSVQYRFDTQYRPEYRSYLNYEPPNYKVRVGDFMKRTEAELFREQIIFDFPGAFLIETKVRVPKYDPVRQR